MKKYHRYEKWECFLNDMYLTKDNNEVENIDKVILFFNDENMFFDTGILMFYNWKYTLENHLTDNSINRISYLGQACCNYKFKVPEITTKKAWFMLDKEVQNKANKTAEKLLKLYLKNERESKQLYFELE